MYNPYTLLNPELLDALLQQPMYFVRQYYARGKQHPAETSIPLLLTHYSLHESDQERSERHIRLLWKDPYRFRSVSYTHLDAYKRQVLNVLGLTHAGNSA